MAIICKIRECGKPQQAKNLCNLHYIRMQRGRDIEAPWKNRISHGMSGTPTYVSWYSMINRVNTHSIKRGKNYNGRGISVCDSWRDFNNFYADMGDRPAGTSLDRINNDGNYEPTNCRWATPIVQAINQRISRTNTSGHKGISWYPSRNKWVVYMNIDGKRKNIGYYVDIADAVSVREEYERVYQAPLLEAVR